MHASLPTDPHLPDYILDSVTVTVVYASPKTIFEKKQHSEIGIAIDQSFTNTSLDACL